MLFPAVASVFADDPNNDRYIVIDIEIAECQGGYAHVFAVPDRTVCTTYGYRCMENEQLFLRDDGGSWVLIDMGTGLTCTEPDKYATIVEACHALGLA